MQHTCHTSNPINDTVHHFFANSVMTTSIVVRRILFPADQELRVEEPTGRAGADLVNRGGIKVDEDGAWYVFAPTGLGEEGLHRTRISNLGFLIGTTVHSQAMFEEIELPGAVSQLSASLANVKMTDL